MSSWPTPAISNARGPDSVAGVIVASLIWFTWNCVIADPNPWIQTGSLRQLLARSWLASSNAPPLSVTTQQSSLWSGEEIIGDETTSSIVIGSRNRASGLLA